MTKEIKDRKDITRLHINNLDPKLIVLFDAVAEYQHVDRAELLHMIMKAPVKRVVDDMVFSTELSIDAMENLQDAMDHIFPDPRETAGGGVKWK